MSEKPVGIWEAQWEDSIRWVRSLPLRFRLTRIPIVGRYLFRSSFVGDPTTHAWLVPIGEDIDQPDSVHMPLDVLRPLIEKAAARARAARCVCREAFECQDFPIDVACIFLGSAFVNAGELGLEPLGVNEAVAHVEHAVSLGLVPTLIWEREILSTFGKPKDTGLAVCLCCDCCCDYRVGLRLGSKQFRQRVFRPEGVTVVVGDACELCGTCAEPEVCSVRAITLGSEKAEIDLEECVGCGHCVMVCPSDAIAFELDPEVDVVGSLLAQVETVTNIA